MSRAEPAGLRRRKSSIGPEAAVQLAVMGYLSTVLRLPVFRRNTGAAVMEYKGRKRFIRYNAKGQADLWLILPGGIHAEIEIKAPGKKPTPEQLEWLDSVRASGGEAFWCDSLDSCIESMETIYRRRGLKT